MYPITDCQDVSDRWDHSTVAFPSQLSPEFRGEVEIGCEAGYFNGGDQVITCLGDIYYHVGDKQPHCKASKRFNYPATVHTSPLPPLIATISLLFYGMKNVKIT